MQVDFNCLLSKSYTYKGHFDEFVFKLCNYIKAQKTNEFLSQNIPVSLFFKNQTGENVACQLDNESLSSFSNDKKEINNYNFITLSLATNFYKQHIIRQIDSRKNYYKDKIEQLKATRKKSLDSCAFDRKTLNVLDSIHQYCDEVLQKKKYTELEEKNDSVLKTMNRYTTYLVNIKETRISRLIHPFKETVKYLRKYLELFKMQCNLRSLNMLIGVAIIIGKNNVLNLSLFMYKKIDSLREEYTGYDYWRVKAYKTSNEINGILDNFSLLFDVIDLNYIFDSKNTNIAIAQENETEVKRAIYGKMSFSKNYFEKYWLAPYSEFENQFKIIKTFFSLVSTNLFLYRDLSFTTQKDIVELQVNNNNRYFALKNYAPFFVNNNLSDFDNFFCRPNCAVLLTSSYAYFETAYLYNADDERFDKEDWFINKIANNHRHRFGFDIDASTIFTSIVYSSMFTMSQFVLRSKLLSLNRSNNHLVRLFKSHQFSTLYEKNICVYSSHGPFIKSETDRVANVVFRQNRLKEQENDTELFVKNMWQESNLSNGKIFPLIQAIASVASLAAILIVWSVSFDTLTISITAAICIVILLACLLFLNIKAKK